MNTLTIKDLHVTEELDINKMRAVRGGLMPIPSNNFVNITPISLDTSKNVFATQSNGTGLDTLISTGNGSAFLTDVYTKSNPYVDNGNSIAL
jgi:hypothetical protein